VSGYRVLVVDDDPSVHEALESYLTLSGYRVLHAHDGRQGAAAAAEARPDLILADIQMPLLDGFGLLEILAADPSLRDVPVIVLSSLDVPTLKIRALEGGAVDYLTKPFHRAELVARIRGALRRSRRFCRADAALSGSLAELPLVVLLQTFELSGRGGTVRLPSLEGMVEVRGGRLALVRQGEATGPEALRRLILLEEGEFRVDSLPPGPDPPFGEALPVQGAVMDAVTYLDELRREAGELLAGDPLVEAVPGRVPPLPAKVALPLPVRRLLAALPGDLKSNARLVGEALGRGDLAIRR
jgi:DNA-binding response OmpR family regulator